MLLNLSGFLNGCIKNYSVVFCYLNHVGTLQRHDHGFVLLEVDVSGVQDLDVTVRYMFLQLLIATLVARHRLASGRDSSKGLLMVKLLASDQRGCVGIAIVLESRSRDSSLEATRSLVVDPLVLGVESTQCLRSLRDKLVVVHVLSLGELIRVVLLLFAVFDVSAHSLCLDTEVRVLLCALHLHLVSDLHGVVDLLSGAFVALLGRVELSVVAVLVSASVLSAEVVGLRGARQVVLLREAEVVRDGRLLPVWMTLNEHGRVRYQLHVALLRRLADLPHLVAGIYLDRLLARIRPIPSGILEGLSVGLLVLSVHLVGHLPVLRVLRNKVKRLPHYA